MNLVNRLQTQYGWTPNFRLVFKKLAPPGLKTFQVPQTNGLAGWIVFTYEKDVPVCLWITGQECKKLPCIVDERICGDTFLKVEKNGELDFIVSDIWMYNSNCVFACSTFQQRYEWLKEFIPTFTSHVPGTVKFSHKSTINTKNIRGYEEYPNEPGKFGYYTENDGSQIVHFVKMNLPDCYESVPFTGYLKVPDIKTSFYLRSKGNEFDCKCLKEDDSWFVAENIPCVE
jgi:hypothetical protein